MATIALKTLNGGEAKVGREAMEAFASSLRGDIVSPDDESYDSVRSIWNAMIDRRPGLIVRCAGNADVMRCVRFARKYDLLVSIRGAGHNIAGNSVADGALLIDLSTMRSVWVDPASRTLRAEPGATLGDLDKETQEHGLALPVGINSTTGIAGLTLGGGFGWLSRKHGMTVDNLISADVVTADAELVTASAESHPELFWGLRGGGGNFGIVTSFEFKVHSVGPQVLSGLVVHRLAEARPALEFYREFAAKAPDELTVWVMLRKAPPLPFLPQEVHGTEVLAFALMYAGDIEQGEKLVAPLREFGSPVGQAVMPHAFTDWQAVFDPLLTPGARNYWKSHNFARLDDGLIDLLLDSAAKLPSPETEIFMAQVGGEQGRVAPDATAYPHRDAAFIMNVHTRWQDAADDERCVAWARELFDSSSAFATGGVYINFMPDDEQERVTSAYGPHWDRLVALKNEYDPENRFRLNQNIRPAHKG